MSLDDFWTPLGPWDDSHVAELKDGARTAATFPPAAKPDENPLVPTLRERNARATLMKGALQLSLSKMAESLEDDSRAAVHNKLLLEVTKKVDELWNEVADTNRFYTSNLQRCIEETVQREVAEACTRLVEKGVTDALRQREIITRDALMLHISQLMPTQPAARDVFLAEEVSRLRGDIALLNTRMDIIDTMPTQRGAQDDIIGEEVLRLRGDIALLNAKVDGYRTQFFEAAKREEVTPASERRGRKKTRKEETAALEEKDIAEQYAAWRSAFAASVGKKTVWLADEIFQKATTDNRGTSRKLLTRRTILAQHEALRDTSGTLLKEHNVSAAVETLYENLLKATAENLRPPRDGKWPVSDWKAVPTKYR